MSETNSDHLSARKPCKYGDPTCPCQDGDTCHYEGKNPWKPPATEAMAEPTHTVAGLMALVSEYGQCRWSEGSSGATYLDRPGVQRSREEAADLYKEIETYAATLAAKDEG